MTLAAKVRHAPMTCGFCSTEHHNLCVRAVRNGNGSIIECHCDQPYCGNQVLRCLTCKNEADGEVGEDWRCIDREACADTQQKRLDANPHLRLVREVMVRVTENATQEKAEKAEKAPKKVTLCVHGCGQPTKGGKFLPGHDAKMVSELVSAVVNDPATTEEAAKQKLVDVEATAALQSKFEKSLKLAREVEAKRAAAREATSAKAAEKAEADAAKAATKQAEVEQEPVPDTESEPESASDSNGAKPAAPAKKAAKKA